MLLGANGQNIYPEEIEDKLNTLPYVSESVVIQKGNELYALVHPDFDEAEKDGVDAAALRRQMEQNKEDLNLQIPAYERIKGVVIWKDEFEKTPKKSIKRYLYLDAKID